MAQEEEQLTERDPNINTISEIPARKFAITMEFPLFLVMMGMSLCDSNDNTIIWYGNIIIFRSCYKQRSVVPNLRPRAKLFRGRMQAIPVNRQD